MKPPLTPDPSGSVRLQAELSAADLPRLHELVVAATTADGVAPLGEHVLLHVSSGAERRAGHLVARAAATLVGYGHLDIAADGGATGELVVAPSHRRHGLGTAIVDAMLARAAPGRLRLWAHGNRPEAARLAIALGFERVRDLLRLRLSFPATPVEAEEVRLPPGVSVRTFVPFEDDAAWVELNARAFAGHPEQGLMTAAHLTARMAEPWFDPAGFFLAERERRLVGFHWTKVHSGSHGHRIGEVYVLGVDPSAQGGGLGRALTMTGLDHLRASGLNEVILYVDGDNARAIRTYQRLGFVYDSTDVMYERAAAPALE